MPVCGSYRGIRMVILTASKIFENMWDEVTVSVQSELRLLIRRV
jgi:hypothetical protein